jgi:conjugative transfer signal peptidase TraF
MLLSIRKCYWLYVFLLSTLVAIVFIISNYRINYSNSEAIGIWRLKSINLPIKRGDHVALCHNLIKIDHYASCYPFLIKTVVGIPGDEIIINNKGVKINHKLLLNSQILARQKSIYITNTTFTLPSHYYWVYGSNNALFSFDSRYFGPVNDVSIIAIACPIFVIQHRL